MDEDGATLEVGFDIQVGDAFGNLRSLDDLIGTTAADAVRQFTRIEAAAKGMIDTSDGTIALRTFGSAATKELETARQAIVKVENAGERMAASLEKSIPFIGKTASEARQLRAETAALAAEGQGLTELATRIRTLAGAYADTEKAASGASSGAVVLGNAHQGASVQTMMLRSAFQNAASSMAAGMPMFRIAAEQGLEVAQAFSMGSGAAGGASTFATIMSGPWGYALQASIVLLGVFIPKIWGAADAEHEHANAAKDATDAISELNKVTSVATLTQGQLAGVHIAAARAEYAQTLQTRDHTKALLEQALAMEKAKSVQAQAYGQRGELGAIGAGIAANRVQQLEAALDQAGAKADATGKRLDAAFRGAVSESIVARAQGSLDKATAATQHYDDALKLLRQEHARGQISDRELYQAVQRETAARDAATHAADRHKVSTRGASDAARDAAKLAREQAAAEKDLDQTLTALEAKYDPLTAAGKEYGKALDEIAKLQAAGRIDDQRSIDMQLKVGEAYGKTVDKIMAEQNDLSKLGFKLPDGKELGDSLMKLVPDFSKMEDALGGIADEAERTASSMQKAFGSVGGSIGDALRVLEQYGKKQNELDAARKAANGDEDKLSALRKQSADNQFNSMIGLTSAAKGLFKEHSAGYKAMAAAEKALTLIQLARTAVDVAGGAARMFSTLGPLAFPAVAAMIGVMASLGFNSGGHSATPKTNDGSGTVLGDSTAKSDSIQRSIDALKDVDATTMIYSRDMLTSLKSIDSQIGSLASLVVRSGSLDTATVGVTEGFKTSTIGNILAGPLNGIASKIPVLGSILGAIGGVIKSLFGTKTKVVGNGIFANPQALSEVLAGGFDGQSYADVQKTKKVFGITTSKKVKTQYGDLDDSINQQFGLILKGFDDAITAAAGPLGLSTNAITQTLDRFVVSVGKIDLTGLTGEEIQTKLENVFGAIGDNMAAAAIPGLEKYQKVGEGYLETLVRVASTVETVTTAMDELGDSGAAAALGLSGAMNLAGQFDSTSDFSSAVDSYFSSFYTDAEQVAAKTAQLGKVFGSLGMSMPASIADFRALVDAQDLSTAAGQATYATLLKLAPAFADLKSAMGDAASAADILRERQDIQRQILEAQGDTAAIRALDLAKLDASNRELQEQLYAIQDAKAAADAAAELADAWSSVGDSIKDEINRIRGLSDASGGGSFASLMGQFNAANTAARAGDMDAAKSLPALSQSLLTAAASAATSRQELDRVQAQTAAMLEQTYAAIGVLSGTSSTSSTTTNLSSAALTATSTASTTSTTADLAAAIASLHDEVAQMRKENTAGHAANAGNTSRMAKKLDDVTAASGGDAISVAAAA
jgi:hypothetical protein